MKNCALCKEINNNNFEHKGKNYGNRILFESKSFVVVPSLGQLLEGHLLILTKKHHVCMGELIDDLFVELNELMVKVRNFLEKHFGSCIFFEHGVFENFLSTEKYVGHARLHALPAKIENLDDGFKKYGSVFVLEKVSDLNSIYNEKKSYLFFENHKQKKFAVIVPHIIPEQFLRRVIVKRLGLNTNWNWKKEPKIDEMLLFANKTRRGISE